MENIILELLLKIFHFGAIWIEKLLITKIAFSGDRRHEQEDQKEIDPVSYLFTENPHSLTQMVSIPKNLSLC